MAEGWWGLFPRDGVRDELADAPVEWAVRFCPNAEVGIKGLKVDVGLRGDGWKACGEVGEVALLPNGSASNGLLNDPEPPVDCCVCAGAGAGAVNASKPKRSSVADFDSWDV